MHEKNSKESWTLWQKARKGIVKHPALIFQKFDEFVGIEQEGQNIAINYESIDEVCKQLKEIKKLHKP